MDIEFFGRGFVIGLAIAAPVGAIGLLCIRRTLVEGRLVGLVSGLGAATADAVYGTVAAFGVTVTNMRPEDSRRGSLRRWPPRRTAPEPIYTRAPWPEAPPPR